MPEKILEIVKHNGEEVIDTYMDQTIAQAKQKDIFSYARYSTAGRDYKKLVDEILANDKGVN